MSARSVWSGTSWEEIDVAQAKATSMREMTADDIRQRLNELREELFNLRLQLSMGIAKNPARVGQAKRDLARAKTMLRERELNIRRSA